MKGYFKDPGATAQAVRAGWIWTGDNAYQDSDGYFYSVGKIQKHILRNRETK